jgi:hypothetical protein
MRRPGDEALDHMRERLLHGPGLLDQSVRREAFNGGAVPDAVAGLVEKIRLHAYKVTDADVEAAQAAGWSDSELFELFVAAAAGAGLHRRDVIDQLLGMPPT